MECNDNLYCQFLFRYGTECFGLVFQSELPFQQCPISSVDMFYVPSFLRGEGVNRMAMLEPWRRIGMPRGSQGEGMT